MEDVTARHALAVLIDQVKANNGLSDEDVARTARSRGHKLSKSNISRIRNEPVESINAAQIHALADGLTLPVAQVLAAALTAMGLPARRTAGEVIDALQSDPMLTQEARAFLLNGYDLLRTQARFTVDPNSPKRGPRRRDEALERETDKIAAARAAERRPPRNGG